MKNRYWSNMFTFVTGTMMFVMANIALRLHFRDEGELFSFFTIVQAVVMGMGITSVKELLVRNKGGK